MSFDNIKDMARALGVSPATVSKAVNHCPGVSSATREEILAASGDLNLPERPGESHSGRRGIYIILPEAPVYFWKALYERLAEQLTARGLEAKINIYSKMGDDRTVLRYLEEAEALDAQVLLVAARCAGIRQELEALAAERAVFMLCSSEAPKNAFLFGSSPYLDGAALCRHCVAEHPQLRRVLLLGSEPERTRGFADTFGGEIRSMALSPADTPATLARRIDELRRTFEPEAVVCLDGIGRIMLMALKKLKLAVPCYGFEQPPIEERYGVLRGEMCQDLASIAKRAVQAAETYLATGTLPGEKHILVESSYRGRA